MITALVGLVGAVTASLLAHLETGGRRELRELAQLTDVAASLEEGEIRNGLLADAALALDAYRRRRDFRPRLLPAFGVGLALAGSVLLAVCTGSNRRTDRRRTL